MTYLIYKVGNSINKKSERCCHKLLTYAARTHPPVLIFIFMNQSFYNCSSNQELLWMSWSQGIVGQNDFLSFHKGWSSVSSAKCDTKGGLQAPFLGIKRISLKFGTKTLFSRTFKSSRLSVSKRTQEHGGLFLYVFAWNDEKIRILRSETNCKKNMRTWEHKNMRMSPENWKIKDSQRFSVVLFYHQWFWNLISAIIVTQLEVQGFGVTTEVTLYPYSPRHNLIKKRLGSHVSENRMWFGNNLNHIFNWNLAQTAY